jgi:PhzF family phenazine biosynthesis protein
MRFRIWQVDAFTSRPFSGNPAAVVVLERWLADAVMLAVAAENNLSETAFLVRGTDGWHIRWFTPVTEVTLCGHATLAAAHTYFTHLEPRATSVTFSSLSGPLVAEREGARFVLDFPAYPCERVETPDALVQAIGATPLETWLGAKLMAVFAHEADVVSLTPDFAKVAALDGLGLIVTAPGESSDIASRFFAPRVGVSEDPVTGSAHCQLAPWWAKRFGKTKLHARQLSKRGGELQCETRGNRVLLSGEAVEYLQGTLDV